MIIIDKLLRELKRPIRVGMIGAGFMGKGIAYQIEKTAGMKLVAISNRTPQKALEAFRLSGHDATYVNSDGGLLSSIESDTKCYMDDPEILCRSELIDVIVEVTGTIEFACKIIAYALMNKKHVVMMNPEVDGTVGVALNKIAQENGVVLTNSDGDQPGVEMNLYRFVKGIGIKPILCGNIRGFHNAYGTPATQQWFADKWHQNVNMVTSFCDGTKVAFEQAIVANATGMSIYKRGMVAPSAEKGKHVKDCLSMFPLDEIKGGSGIVDYVLGAEPSPGIFVVGYCPDSFLMHYLNLFKLGDGPFYCFYRPYHLCFFEVPNTIARVFIFKDETMTPVGQYVDVVAVAKTGLKSGDILDGPGGSLTYGIAETYRESTKNELLPMGLSSGCVIKNSMIKDQVITYSDVEIPKGRYCDTLRSVITFQYILRPCERESPRSEVLRASLAVG